MTEYTEECLYLEVLNTDTFAWKYGPLPWDEALVTHEWIDDRFFPVLWRNQKMPDASESFWNQAQQQLQAGVIDAHYEADDDNGVYQVDKTGYRTLICMVSNWGYADEIAYALNQTFPACNTNIYRQARREAAEKRMQSVLAALTAPPPYVASE